MDVKLPLEDFQADVGLMASSREYDRYQFSFVAFGGCRHCRFVLRNDKW
jgi:hypothetical protein